ncbi:MAG: hypothetical protein MZV70_21960 [Desulfobacterales bacterium]|nr:hypothetical protein [Desulfobacterales bacterium]
MILAEVSARSRPSSEILYSVDDPEAGEDRLGEGGREGVLVLRGGYDVPARQQAGRGALGSLRWMAL